MLVVAKFGGTSVGDAYAFKQVVSIVQNNINIRVVVLSAVSGITNKLIEIFKYPYSSRKNKCLEIILLHKNIIKQLELNHDKTYTLIQPLFDELFLISSFAATITLLDQLLSIGERLSSIIMAELLKQCEVKAIFIDARGLIITDNFFGRATPEINEIKLKCQIKVTPLIKDYVVVTQGFIGSTIEGLTTTLGRGGSDYSAALFAEALNANLLEIYTDVKGVYTGDPKLIPNAQIISNLSFSMMEELSKSGAKVLHPSALSPCIRMNIPIMIKSTFVPEEGGTLIKGNDQNSEDSSVIAVTLRKGQALLTIKKTSQLILDNIFSIINRYRINAHMMNNDEMSIKILIDITNIYPCNIRTLSHHSFLNELQCITEVSIEENLSVLTLVGKSINKISSSLQKILISVDFPITIGLNELSNISLLTHDKFAQILMQLLHNEFFENNKYVT